MSSRIVLPLLLLLAAGCSSWHVAKEPVQTTVLRQHDRAIQVVTSGDTVVLRSPYVANDSLVGLREDARANLIRRYAIALPDIVQIRVRKADEFRTLLLVAGVMGGAAIIAALAGGDKPAPRNPNTGNCGGSNPDDTCFFYSCPLVYSWDGHRYRLDSGTFGGAVMHALQRTDLDNLDHVEPDGGLVRLRVANELNETDHVDALAVLAVDHAPGVAVAPDPSGRVHAFATPAEPVSAVDYRGRDVLARVVARDDRYWVSDPTGRDSARASDVRDGVELTFTRPAGAETAHLVVDANNTGWATRLVGDWLNAHGSGVEAWYDSLDADPARAGAVMAPLAREGFLTVSAWNGSRWIVVGQLWEAGPEIIKRQVLEMDLRRFPGETVRVRLESAPSFWAVDHAAMAFGADEPEITQELRMVRAMTSTGRDVRQTLHQVDGHELVMETGDAAEVAFEAPMPTAGLERTFLLRSHGWYHVNTTPLREADVVLLDRIAHEPLAVSRIAVGRMNDALARLRAEAGQ